MKTLKISLLWFVAFALSLALSKKFVGTAADKDEFQIEKFSTKNQPAAVTLEYFIAENLKPLAKIVGSNKQASKLAENDVIYIKFGNTAVSPGDKFLVYKDLGPVTKAHSAFQSVGHQIHLKGMIVVTQVLEKIVEAKIVESKLDILKGDLITAYFDQAFKVNPQEPLVDAKGEVLGAASQVKLIGAYDFAFVNLGLKDGLRLNDRLKVYVSGDGNRKITKGLPEVTIAELVVVHLDDKLATTYVMSAKDTFERGSAVKTDRKLVRFLEDQPAQVDSAQKPPSLPNQ